MANFNQAILMGNLTQDPVLRELPSGDKVCDFRIAVNNTHSKNPETLYMDVSCWNGQAVNCDKYLTKGRNVAVVGRIKLEQWTDTEGNKRSKHSVVANTVQFLGSSPQSSETSRETETETETADTSF